MPNPRIAPIRLGRYLIIDSRDAPEDVEKRALWRASRGYRQWQESIPADDPVKGRLLCHEDGERLRRDLEQYESLLERFPNLTWERFLEEGGGVREDADWDRSKPFIIMTVLKDGVGHGKFSITNIEFEVDDAGGIEASGFPMYFAEPGTVREMAIEAGRLIQYFLDNDIELRSGRMIDFVEFNFPGVPGSPGWREDDRYGFAPLWRAIRAVGVRQRDRAAPEYVPRRIRRLDAPRQFDGGEVVERRLPPRLLAALRDS